MELIYEYFQNPNRNAIGYVVALPAEASGNVPKNPRFGSKGFSQVAGPVVKNKLFFFFNYEYNAVGQSATPASPLVPTASGWDALDALTGVNYTAPAAARNYLVPGLDQFNNVRAGKESSRAIHEACKCQRSSSSKCRVRGVQRSPSFRAIS